MAILTYWLNRYIPVKHGLPSQNELLATQKDRLDWLFNSGADGLTALIYLNQCNTCYTYYVTHCSRAVPKMILSP